jgi:hypothetical protein
MMVALSGSPGLLLDEEREVLRRTGRMVPTGIGEAMA